MNRHLSNAAFGILDYVSYPAGMLLVAPIVLHRLGAAEYGLWMIATAVISAGGIVASGFGDACIQRIAYLRGVNEPESVPDALQSILMINLGFGALLALGVWFAAPFAAYRIAVMQAAPPGECLIALRIAGIAILLRAMESVPVGGQRAFEQYRETVQISAVARLVTLAAAAGLAACGEGTIAILLATCGFLLLGTAMQFRALRKLTELRALRLKFHRSEVRLLMKNGFFVWLQAVSGLVFAQFDRILVGVSLGALAVTPYALCVQFAHPLLGVSASGLNFIFPYLSRQAAAASKHRLMHALARAIACNLAIVLCGAVLLLVFGHSLIRVWAGSAIAANMQSIFLAIVAGSALTGLSVTGTYALQALGDFQTAAWIGLASRAIMLLLMIELLRRHGVQGIAQARLYYGVLSLFVYVPLLRRLRTGKSAHRVPLTSAFNTEVQEVSQP
jgi:O-antigen/teichoic acid export membrane protein